VDFKKLLEKLKPRKNGNVKVEFKEVEPKDEEIKPLSDQVSNYYKQAQGWGHDVLTGMTKERNKWRGLFYVSSALCVLSVLTIMMMVPLRTIVPILLKTDKNGLTYTIPVDFTTKFKHSPEQIRSEIYSYVQAYESYEAGSFRFATEMIRSQSSNLVLNKFLEQISSDKSYVNYLGKDGYRKVYVESIQFWDSKENKGHLNAANTAIVTFKTVEGVYAKGQAKTHLWRAIVGWEFKGFPKEIQQQFLNYDGFTITAYNVTELNKEVG
jgi:type IV secretion system protein VirB8